MSAPEWESSKENVLPVSHGRSVPALNDALAMKAEDLNRQRALHEAAIRDGQNGIGPYAADPLGPWVMYAKWVVDFFPRGSDLIVSVVEGACRRYAKDPKYRNDRRFVRLWIRYADLRDDKLDVFEYMQRHRIGEVVALYYEAWATTLELAKQYDKAEQTYALGLRMGAEPAQRLGQRQREYFARMAARARRAEKRAKDAEERKKDVARAKDTRAARGRATLADDILARPDGHDAAMSGPGDASPGPVASSSTKVRPALGPISERQALTGRRPMSSARSSKPRLGQKSTVVSPRPDENRGAQVERFEIFTDASASSESLLAVHHGRTMEADGFPFKPISKREEVQKENGGLLPSKWAGETLPQSAKAKSVLDRHRTAAQTHVEIYQEPDVEEAYSPTPPPKGSMSTREPLEEEDIRSPNHHRRSSGMGATSPTINTKLALQEVEDLFNSSLPMERAREEARVESFSAQRAATRDEKKMQQPAFEIYMDGNENLSAQTSAQSSSAIPSQNMADKENALGVRKPLTRMGDHEGSAGLGKRVLRPIEQAGDEQGQTGCEDMSERQTEPSRESHLESRDGLQQKSDMHIDEHIEELGDGHAETTVACEHMDFLANWCIKEPGYHLLDGPDPEVEKDGLFDLEPPGQPITSFNVDMYMWQGYEDKSEVVFVEDLCNVLELRDSEDMDSGADHRLALKMSENDNSTWEFYIYRMVHDRYGTPIRSVPSAVAFYIGNPRSYLILDSVAPCTLAELVTFSGDELIPEPVAMFLVVDLLRTLEAIHTTGIIHGDVTLNNVLFRDDVDVELSENTYNGSSASTWGSKGVSVVDFNHAVDSQLVDGDVNALARHVSKLGNVFLADDYRRKDTALWSFNTDCYAASVCARKLLKLDGTENVDSKLKHSAIWRRFFEAMADIGYTARGVETSDVMKRCRAEMEAALKGDLGLRGSLVRLCGEVERRNSF